MLILAALIAACAALTPRRPAPDLQTIQAEPDDGGGGEEWVVPPPRREIAI